MERESFQGGLASSRELIDSQVTRLITRIDAVRTKAVLL